MSKQVTIVDYGIGNIFSVARAIEKCGAEPVLTDDPALILKADRLVLPGVGAFARGMQGLAERGLVAPLQEYARKGRPLLGICLGMQMLFDRSTEFGDHAGLGLIQGDIRAIEPGSVAGAALKVPHIGWSPLVLPPECTGWERTILDQAAPGVTAYFVHSFTAVPLREQDRLADAHYGAARISATVRKGNIYGCQFHPEKSGATGLRMLDSFLQI